MNRRYWNILWVVCALLTASITRADVYDDMRQRLLDKVALGTNFDTSDPDVTAYVTAMDNNTASLWSSMEKSPTTKGYLWSAYNKLTGDATYTPAHVWHTYGNLRTMARSYACPASTYYHNASLLADIKMGLNFLYSIAFNGSTSPIGNFYEWRIGIPEYYGHIVTMLYDELTASQLNNYDVSVGHMIRDLAVNGNMTYANQANVCQELITLGIISKKSADIQSALSNSVRVFVDATTVTQRNTAQAQFEKCWKAQGDYHQYSVGKKEGYYPDGTFIQHIAIPYIGAYGMEMIELSSFMARILTGTDFTVPASIIAALPDLIQKTYLPAIYKGEMMYMFMGRSTSANPFQNADHILLDSYLSAKQYISDASVQAGIIAKCKSGIQPLTYSATVFGSMSPLRDKPVYNSLMAETASTASVETFALFYPCGDRLIFQTDRFRFGLSMSSARIGKFESINNMNTKGWYLGDGMTYLYLPTDRQQYVNYFSNNLNWQRLAGTTVDALKRTAETNNYGLFGTPKKQKDWVGGLDFRGQYAQAGMHLQGQVSSLQARKSWFCFTDEIVCLGAGITMTEARKAESVIENRKSTAAFTIDGVARQNKKGVELTHTNPSYMHLDGTGGYYFPNANQDVCSFISYDGYSMIYFNHGVTPSNASYAYVLLPGMTAEETAAYASDAPVRILRNDTVIQAAVHTTTGVTGINFWSAGTCHGVTSDGAASVMFWQNGQDLFIALSEPTWKRTIQTFTLKGDFRLRAASVSGIVSLQSNGTTTTVTVNTTDRWGQSVELQLRGILDTSDSEGIDEIANRQSSNRKYLEDGFLLIRVGDQTYNTLGQKIN